MIEISFFRLTDYDEVMALWSCTDGLTLRDADSRDAIARYLAHNPGLSFVARDGGRLVGAVLAGTDGRRGYLQHLAVAPSHRGRGLGRGLAERAMLALRAAGSRSATSWCGRRTPRHERSGCIWAGMSEETWCSCPTQSRAQRTPDPTCSPRLGLEESQIPCTGTARRPALPASSMSPRSGSAGPATAPPPPPPAAGAPARPAAPG
jgi:N-acetylglutamate synthase